MNDNKTNFLIRFLQKYGCDHDYKFVHNIYGDEINYVGGYRSVWKCNKCGNVQYREDLHITNTLCEELDKLYNDFYKDQYNSWKISRSETLNMMLKTMREAAFNGKCYADFILICEEKCDDRYYYQKWFDENALKYEYKLHNQQEKCTELNSYEFHVRWNYK